jgi:hypothetical protein
VQSRWQVYCKLQAGTAQLVQTVRAYYTDSHLVFSLHIRLKY